MFGQLVNGFYGFTKFLGNDAGSSDQCNFDGYANMRYAILIGSSVKSGEGGGYSEPCAAMMAVAPGGATGRKYQDKIVTTDLMGSDGLNAQ